MPQQSAALPGWLKPANRVVRALHRVGLPLGTIHVLTVPGRTTGAPRSTPVSPLRVDGREFVIAALPDCDWARNARAAGRGELRRGRRVRPISLIEVRDPDLRTAVMRAFPREVPHGVAFFVRIGLVQGADPEQFAAAAGRVAVFEIHGAVEPR
ncbi:nitroreductase/quinone reductase family protein [Pseudonocardia lacus]|uniref:nitroreductase/quinone reductase family protein n=1 Tax=Pseudonocardia lacus TaxID=2835865 RepID=UPI001BDDB205|nr:nitroreductase/quinone reductase family protein [Pseudonocardia lacus]